MVARCARLKSMRGALREAAEQAAGELFFVCGFFASFAIVPWLIRVDCQLRRKALRSAPPLEEELKSLRKELEDRRAEEEKAAQARDALASRLRSVADGLSGES